mmetsp:Transcript_29995/g.69819  ORF Transcript_29995/g.69819 Transcript_29995/m.69819 type:complete len:85 (-) Transcript_29995:649-903(-)
MNFLDAADFENFSFRFRDIYQLPILTNTNKTFGPRGSLHDAMPWRTLQGLHGANVGREVQGGQAYASNQARKHGMGVMTAAIGN